jgi:hypothetical protein
MLDEPHRDGDDERLASFPAVCINGLRTRSSVVVAPSGRCRVLGIRFEPTGACRVLHASMKALVDVTIDLRDALGRSAAELGERCNDAAESPRSSPRERRPLRCSLPRNGRCNSSTTTPV